ncbi:MAG: hypothetical protein JO259_02140 [Mycobacterium sp.]|nr:hypothetical protein [Mycobacterium sp.]
MSLQRSLRADQDGSAQPHAGVDEVQEAVDGVGRSGTSAVSGDLLAPPQTKGWATRLQGVILSHARAYRLNPSAGEAG